jgi:hypothetical protein
MSLLSDLQHYQSKRKFPNWQPKPNTGLKQMEGTPQEQVVLRCLAFVDLEVQVGDWITYVAEDDDPEWCEHITPILLRNVADEVKHDSAIRDLKDYYRDNHSLFSPNRRVEVLVEQWKQSKASPVVNAYALEMGIFFTILPILMKCGDVYAATVASWINDDERVHVETNLRLMKHFGLKLTEELIWLVFNTVAYIYEPLGEERANAEANRAVKRLVSTKDPQMLTESLPITISYFEQNTNQDIVYS